MRTGALVLVLPAVAAAQAPAALPPVAAAKDKPPPFREGAIDFSFIATTGNTDSQALGLGGDGISTAVFDTGSAYRLKFSESAEFTDDFRCGQSLSDGGDTRLGHTAAVTARLTGLLSLKVSHTIRFANQPPPGFENTDTDMAVALVPKF